MDNINRQIQAIIDKLDHAMDICTGNCVIKGYCGVLICDTCGEVDAVSV